MLQEIYINNFRNLVGFHLKDLNSINLFLGENGSGKSSVFDCLQKIKSLASTDPVRKVGSVFDLQTCTRWNTNPVQSQDFRLKIDGNGGSYSYNLSIEHQIGSGKSHIKHEKLSFEDKLLFRYAGYKAQVYSDDGDSVSELEFDRSKSMLSWPGSYFGEANIKTKWFQERIKRFIILRIHPVLTLDGYIEENSKSSIESLPSFLWTKYWSHNDIKLLELTKVLREILPGFVCFKDESKPFVPPAMLRFQGRENRVDLIEYALPELSDGQRMLVILYAMLYSSALEDATLCIDEPENFLSLPEIQPWLMELYDICGMGKRQVLLISHHPEFIDLLASSSGHWFEYEANTPVRVKPIKDNKETGLPISELIARGWLYD